MSRFLPWKIVHVAVRERLPDLRVEPELGGLFVVFWCDSVPVGQLWIPASLLPITSSQLLATVPPLIALAVTDRLLSTGLRAPLHADSREQSPEQLPVLASVLEFNRPLESCSRLAVPSQSREAESVEPSVSVVICTRNRPEALEKCLWSIRSLSPPPNEIIVVDNDPLSGLSQATTAAFPEVRYVREPRPGLSAARNTGIRNCVGEIIAFTDDDVMVHSGWIRAIRDVFHDPDVIATTGLVLPAELATHAQYAFQVGDIGWALGYRALDFDQNFFISRKRVGAPVWQIGAGANMSFRRGAFERVGFFDERLGAGTSGCSEDSELWYRLLAEGYRCRYEPAAVVFHIHRSDWKGLSDQTYNYMRGHVAALLFQFDRYRHWGNIRRAFLGLPFHFMRLAIQNLQKTIESLIFDSGKESLSLLLGQQIWGIVAGYGYYLRYRRLRADPTNTRIVRAGGLEPSAEGRNNGV
jgi:GT2 family glycosyltransferase